MAPADWKKGRTGAGGRILISDKGMFEVLTHEAVFVATFFAATLALLSSDTDVVQTPSKGEASRKALCHEFASSVIFGVPSVIGRQAFEFLRCCSYLVERVPPVSQPGGGRCGQGVVEARDDPGRTVQRLARRRRVKLLDRVDIDAGGVLPGCWPGLAERQHVLVTAGGYRQDDTADTLSLALTPDYRYLATGPYSSRGLVLPGSRFP